MRFANANSANGAGSLILWARSAFLRLAIWMLVNDD